MTNLIAPADGKSVTRRFREIDTWFLVFWLRQPLSRPGANFIIHTHIIEKHSIRTKPKMMHMQQNAMEEIIATLHASDDPALALGSSRMNH